MANITITIPDTIAADVVAALKAHYAVGAVTNRELVALHIRSTVGPIYRAYKRTNSTAVTTAKATLDSTIATQEAAESAARQAIQDAEKTADNLAKAAIDGVV